MIRRALGFLLTAWGAASLLGLLVLSGLALSAGWWLRAEDEPRPADAIVLLAGDLRRAPHAGDLYLRGLAPVIYVGRPFHDPPKRLCELGLACPREEDQMLMVLGLMGVPPQAVRFYGQELLSTVEEVENLGRVLSPGQKTLLVVTSPSHSRRVKMLLARHLPERALVMSPTPEVRFETKWWTHPESAKCVVSELAKFAFGLMGRAFRSHGQGLAAPDGQEGQTGQADQAGQAGAITQANQTGQ